MRISTDNALKVEFLDDDALIMTRSCGCMLKTERSEETGLLSVQATTPNHCSRFPSCMTNFMHLKTMAQELFDKECATPRVAEDEAS